jgi:hypothetical protein
MSSFNPRNHGTLSFRRKERPCLKSEFLDVAPSRAALVRAETHGTMSNRVSWEVRSGRFGLDAKLNKPPPQSQTRVWTSPHCPRAAPEHVSSLSQDHPRFPYHHKTGRFTDPGSAADTMQAAPRHFIAERTSGTVDLGKPGRLSLRVRLHRVACSRRSRHVRSDLDLASQQRASGGFGLTLQRRVCLRSRRAAISALVPAWLGLRAESLAAVRSCAAKSLLVETKRCGPLPRASQRLDQRAHTIPETGQWDAPDRLWSH